MKVLIITMTCGEGHNMMAKALASQFEKHGAQIKIVETYGYDDRKVKSNNAGFLWLCKHIPKTYDFIWNQLRKVNHKKFQSSLKRAKDYLEKEINITSPDIIMCTHVFASNAVSQLRLEGKLDKNITVSTIVQDFCLCPYWEHSSFVDYVFQPYENTTQELLQKGFKLNQIQTFGLPIRDIIKTAGGGVNTLDLRKKLKLENKFTVLIMTGGFGLGNNVKLVDNIVKKRLDINIVVMNGRNAKNYAKIEKYCKKHNLNNVYNNGYVDNIAEYMRASDICITRCGSSTVCETIASGLPFIAREKMIINEKITAKLFDDFGCSLKMKKLSDAGTLVEKIYNNPTLLESMKSCVKKYARPHAAENIVKFLISKKQTN